MMPSTSLQIVHEEVCCSICSGFPRDPVTYLCGHIFCRLCLIPPSPKGAHPPRLCPICKEKKQPEALQPQSWATKNLKLLGHGGETHCDEHGEKIYFFCENDGEFLCVLCRESSNHQAHAVVLLDEATQPYRERLKSRLEVLHEEKEEMERMKSREEQKLQVLLTQIESKKQQVEEAFEQLQQILEDQQRLLLDKLGELKKEIWKERDHYIDKVSEEIVQLDLHIKELEGKCQQSANELLKDVKMTQNRYEKERFSPESISPGLARRIHDLHQKMRVLPEMMEKFSENLLLHLDTNAGGITLDPQTASWSLILSTDRKSVRYTKQKQNLQENPQRFDRLPAVLGAQGFSSGKHSWEIEVVLGDGGGCTVGVAREDMKRKGDMGLSTEEGVWAVIFSYHQCWASTCPGTDLQLNEIPHRVQVTLDYSGGHVTLSNAETQTTIFTFLTSFSGKIFPFFAVWKKGSQLTLKT
ncbi:tripartite motif-containing protein 15 [Sarcophilus harrisii]|uniref:tripartite motif-containing protein 15 n=1 Tax=Sarcophilus harrisii TaxID=9305 RepID=UPI001301EF45|nr:tripartite motif-containing protein 15 [Sarcophilus harrisii]